MLSNQGGGGGGSLKDRRKSSRPSSTGLGNGVVAAVQVKFTQSVLFSVLHSMFVNND